MNRPPARPRPAAAFTLVEVVVVIALMAVMIGVFVANLDSLTGGELRRPLPDILQKAVRDARYEAASTKEPVTLSFDAERGVFVVRAQDGTIAKERESGFGPKSRELEITFYRLLPARGTGGIGSREERDVITAVAFHPDRSSTPFVVELEIDGQRSEHRFDPFSNLEFARK